MTKENAIRLYKHYSEMAENPRGADQLERKNVKEQALKAKADMELHIKASEYAQDSEIIKLLGVSTTQLKKASQNGSKEQIELSEDKDETKETKQEKKTDGKKSKG